MMMEENVKMRELELKQRELELQERKFEREQAHKEREFELTRVTREREQAHRDSMGAKLKLWGDAMRNAIPSMPEQPIEVVSWFISLERLYEQLKVPVELRAVLMRPYLTVRAKTLLARCDISESADYEAIKKYLLQEMR